MPFSDLFGRRVRGWKPKTILVEPSIKPASDDSKSDESDEDQDEDKGDGDAAN